MNMQDFVQREIAFKNLVFMCQEWLSAIKNNQYVSVDERMKGIDDIATALPVLRRHLIYLKTQEINKT